MRLAFFVLVFANLAILAFSQLDTSEPERARHQIAQLELRPDLIRIISAADAHRTEAARPQVTREQENSQSNMSPPEAPVCVEWAGIAPQDLERSRLVLASLTATYKTVGSKATTDYYWVHIPGLKTSTAVDSVLTQLKAADEPHYAVTRRGAEGTYDISLGVFKNEARAKQRHARFQSMGAVLTPRGTDRTTYLVQNLVLDTEKLVAAARAAPGTTVTVVTCPEPFPEKDEDTSVRASSR
jgi:hypothetical protein